MSEVQKLAARHHQISETEQRRDCSAWTGDHLQQQPGRRPLGHKDVGHGGSHDLCGQMISRCDRDNAPRGPSDRRGEGIAHTRIGQGEESLWRATPEVVQPVIGVGRQPNLPHPRPHLVSSRPHSHSAPRLHRRIRHHLVARVTSARLRLSDSPLVANHARHRSVDLTLPSAMWREYPSVASISRQPDPRLGSQRLRSRLGVPANGCRQLEQFGRSGGCHASVVERDRFGAHDPFLHEWQAADRNACPASP
jgi:hypothetical protein